MQDRGVIFHEGIPDHNALVQWFPQGQGVFVLDNLMDEGSNDKRVLDLFTNTSIIKTSRSGHVSHGETCQKTFQQSPLHRGFEKPTRSIGGK